MQFYARFRDEVVAEPQTIAAHVSASREESRRRSRTIFDEALVAGARAARANPRDAAAKVAFVTIYHLLIEATLGLTAFEFIDAVPAREGAAARASSRATRRSTTTSSGTSGTGSGSCGRPSPATPSSRDRVRRPARPAPVGRRRAGSAGPRGHGLGGARRERRRDPRLRAQRAHPAAQHRGRSAHQPLRRARPRQYGQWACSSSCARCRSSTRPCSRSCCSSGSLPATRRRRRCAAGATAACGSCCRSLSIVAVRRRVIPFWLAVVVAVIGGVGPYAGRSAS